MLDMRSSLIALAAGVVWSACAESVGPTAPDGVGPPETAARSELHILRQGPAAPPLKTYQASVWACTDRSQTLSVYYAGGDDDDDDDARREFLRLTVPAGSLHRWPDGRRFRDGECVLITARVDASLLLVEFDPAGLVFSRSNPARLGLSYARANADVDDDGDVDATDAQIVSDQLWIWRLPHGNQRWEKLSALHATDVRRFDADLFGFSHYAIAW